MINGLSDFLKLNKHMYKYSHKQVEEYQKKEILKLVKYAVEYSPYYREKYRGIELSDFSWEDFYKLPIIDKQIMMDNFDGINTCELDLDQVKEYAVEKELKKDYFGYYKGEYVVGLSSGTSGNKGIFITPKSMTKRLPFVFLARSGISLKLLPFRILFLLRVFSQGFADINSPFVKLNYLSTMTTIEKIINEINESKINILMGPPSLIRLLIPYKSMIKSKLKIIVSYAEVMEVEEKQRFTKIFGTPVIEIYQASEGQIGSTCKHGNLHINEDLVFVELYDSQGKSIEESNIVATKMLVTNLVNMAQPLIRYEMNDLIMLGEPCPCGSHFRVIKKVLGRHDDVLYLKTSNNVLQHIFPDLFSRWIITVSDNIREFKVVQCSNSSLEIILDLFDKNTESINKVKEDLKLRLDAELVAFNIIIEINIFIEEISLPEDRSKYKRFSHKGKVKDEVERI